MKKTQKITEITKFEKEVFEYLNKLRRSGETNMFGACPYIVERFYIQRNEASRILTLWMHNFNDDGYEHLTIKG